MTIRSRRTTEFGDFQTPFHLAKRVCALLTANGSVPETVIEPTCGKGTFMEAAVENFPTATICGYECNPSYVKAASRKFVEHSRVSVEAGDFFRLDWDENLSRFPDPVLILGNPPWATNAVIGSIGGSNLPQKSNVDRLRGIEALTGSANFDISEWMIRENFRWLKLRAGTIAVLCKTSVARKVLVYAWSRKFPIEDAAIYKIDAKREFQVSVDACLLYVKIRSGGDARECSVYESLDSTAPSSIFGVRDQRLVSNLGTYERLNFLCSPGLKGWRSGVKHDCSRVFECSLRNGKFENGFGEHVRIESEVMFPLMKSSDVANQRSPRKYVLIPHRSMGESPDHLKTAAPNAWRYLTSHRRIIEKRASAIYKKRPNFSIFGVGPYSFAPWKVAISGLYKEFNFTKLGPIDGRSVILDDTCYFFPCDTEQECEVLHKMASSPLARELWSSLVFWDAKRPITANRLNLLDLAHLAKKMGLWNSVTRRLAERQITPYNTNAYQPMLFRDRSSKYGVSQHIESSRASLCGASGSEYMSE